MDRSDRELEVRDVCPKALALYGFAAQQLFLARHPLSGRMRESMALCGKHPEAEMHSYENPGQPGRVGRWQALGFFALAGALFAGPLNECAFASDGLSPVAAETPISATTTGFMPFTAGVTKGGDAYINIAIDLGRMPPGLSPGLTLSHVGRGELERHTRHEATDALGYGWFIDGTSKISWCAKDARPRPRDLKLDGSDPLCVANRRMVLAHGEHLQPGAEYRTLLERFERVVVRGGPDLTDIWFELFRPDGLVAEYGRTSDARHLAPSASDREGSPDGAIPIAWSVNRLTDEMGSEMRIEYFDDDSGAGYLNRVTYGYGQAGEVRMRYAPRSDVSTVTVGNYSHTHRLRLHRIEAYVQGKKTREYRLESERSESGWERLSRIQLCLFVGDGVRKLPGAHRSGLVPTARRAAAHPDRRRRGREPRPNRPVHLRHVVGRGIARLHLRCGREPIWRVHTDGGRAPRSGWHGWILKGGRDGLRANGVGWPADTYPLRLPGPVLAQCQQLGRCRIRRYPANRPDDGNPDLHPVSTRLSALWTTKRLHRVRRPVYAEPPTPRILRPCE